MSTGLAPICIFVYNRPQHTEKMLQSLVANVLFMDSEIFVFADGPKLDASPDDIEKVKQVREKLNILKSNKNIHYNFSEINKGLTKSIVNGITDVINKYGKVIVVEDDLELSPGFLSYMNDALTLYEKEERVMHVGGYMAPNSTKTNNTMFFRAPTIWGWGTWKRCWQQAEFDANKLLKDIKSTKIKNIEYEFNVRDGYFYFWLLKQIANKKVNAWSISWYANIFLNNRLCLVPKKSLVRNIGFDNTGTNCEPTNIFSLQEITDTISIKKERLIESEECVQAFLDLWKLQSIKVKEEKEGFEKFTDYTASLIKRIIRKLFS